MGLAFLSICAFWQMYDTVIPLMLKNTFGLGETVTGFIMGLDNILALFLLPLFGAFSDKVHTPIGKRTPFIVVGTIAAVIAMGFIPIADKKGNIVLFMICLGFVLIAMGTYRSPAVALMPDLTPKPLRSKANSVINLMGAIGGVYTLIIIKILVNKEKSDYKTVFIAVASIMVVAVILLLLTIRENKLAKQINLEEGIRQAEEGSSSEKEEQFSASKKKLTTQEKTSAIAKETKDLSKEDDKMSPEVRRSFILLLSSIFLWFTAYNAVTTAYSRYTEQVWGLEAGGFADSLLIATIAAICSYIPIGIIASHFGRKKTIITGIILMTFSYFCGALFVNYSPLINVVFAFTGIGWAAINVNSYPMVVEMCKGADIGKYTGLYYTFSMAAQIITPTLSGFLLEHVSYRTLFPYAIIFSIASLCTMSLVKHGDSRPPKKKDVLENFEALD